MSVDVKYDHNAAAVPVCSRHIFDFYTSNTFASWKLKAKVAVAFSVSLTCYLQFSTSRITYGPHRSSYSSVATAFNQSLNDQ